MELAINNHIKMRTCPTCKVNLIFQQKLPYCDECLKKYREKRGSEKFTCECGLTYTIYTRNRHLSSQKHKLLTLCRQNNIKVN